MLNIVIEITLPYHTNAFKEGSFVKVKMAGSKDIS